MTVLAWVGLGAAAVAAVDWWAVARENRRVVYVAKPATLVALIVVAVALEPVDEARRALFVVALRFCLAGDIFLMLPRDMFGAGLGSFFVAHVAYIGGFLVDGVAPARFLLAAVVLSVLAVPLLMPVVRALRARSSSLMLPVLAYAGIITAMVAAAVAYGRVVAVMGALLFYVSDFLIARTRFVSPQTWGPVAIIVAYHLGQGALVTSLLG